MKKRKNVLFSFCFSVFIVAACTAASIAVLAADFKEDAVSPALAVLAEDNAMAVAGLRGSQVEFEREDFARAMNMKTSSIDSITVTELPSIAAGELRLGEKAVAAGQRIDASALDKLNYQPLSVVSCASFKFKVEGFNHEMSCNIHLLDRANQSPTLSTASAASLNVSTHKNVMLYGTLSCYDSEGDTTFIDVVSYPEHGSLIITDNELGEYTYLPDENFFGKDSFTYVARDIYGNYSASEVVSLTVSKPQTTAVYADMENTPEYNAALTMTELGLMNGTQVGKSVYFYPEKEVSRGEFTVLTMNALGITEVAPCQKTVFADDKDIPAEMKGYIDAAYRLGYVHGILKNGELYFECNRPITRSEAAVLVGNTLDLATPTVTPSFKDSSDIPVWAAPSVYSLASVGVMNYESGKIEPLAAITRKDAAVILSNLVNLED